MSNNGQILQCCSKTEPYMKACSCTCSTSEAVWSRGLGAGLEIWRSQVQVLFCLLS